MEGYRPGAIFKLEEHQRRDLLHQGHNQRHVQNISLEWIRSAPPEEILQWLKQELKTLGLEKFIPHCALPLIYLMDLGWKTGGIDIASEHLISDQFGIALHQYLECCRQKNRVSPSARHYLCQTLNPERHKLGLLMAASIIANSGLRCSWMQEDIPLSQTCAALEGTGANAVALSFSTHYSTRAAMEQLATLRHILPESIPILAGGGALGGRRTSPLSISPPILCICAQSLPRSRQVTIL